MKYLPIHSFLLLAVILLTSCGYKGPLYLPKKTAASQPTGRNQYAPPAPKPTVMPAAAESTAGQTVPAGPAN